MFICCAAHDRVSLQKYLSRHYRGNIIFIVIIFSIIKRAAITCLGSSSTVFKDRLGPTKLGVARVDLVIIITLQDNSFSACSHKTVWTDRDKRKFEFLSFEYYITLLLHMYYYIDITTLSI